VMEGDSDGVGRWGECGLVSGNVVGCRSIVRHLVEDIGGLGRLWVVSRIRGKRGIYWLDGVCIGLEG
jgi:hypothetical protein